MSVRERLRAGEEVLEAAGMQYAARRFRRLVWARFALFWASVVMVGVFVVVAVASV